MTHHVGERFAQAIAERNAAELKALLGPGVDFRAMTPGKFWESHDVDEIVDQTILGTWFTPERKISAVVAVDTDSLGLLERVGYRFTGDRPEGRFVIEQQVYYQTSGATIAWLRIMCSGFLPVAQSRLE